ncbi:hypothetical protein SCACP_05640 [Sporomusa carbonis]|uniref:HlyD family secretion protein n=1 Tax=Sporomusa carbonis TaxID=3076075 RepID=UPI003A697C51
MNKKLIAGISIFLLLALVAGYKLFGHKDEGITATGTVEVTRADITPKVSGYVTELSIKAGDSVTAGQVVVRIARPDLEAQLLRDQAALAKAQAQLEDLEKGSRSQERSEAAANLSAAQAVYDKAKNDLERLRALYKEGAISAQQLDAANSNHDVAYNSLLAAQSRQSLVEEGQRPDAIEAQRIEVKRSQAIVDASRSMLDDTVVKSPFGNKYHLAVDNPADAMAGVTDALQRAGVLITELKEIEPTLEDVFVALASEGG